MKINIEKILIRIVAVVVIAIGLFNVIGSIFVLIASYFPQLSFGYVTQPLNRLPTTGFILMFIFYLFLFISGLGLFKLKRWAVNLLIVLLICNAFYIFTSKEACAIAANLFSSPDNKLSHKLGFIAAFLYKEALFLALSIIFFSLPSIQKQFSGAIKNQLIK